MYYKKQLIKAKKEKSELKENVVFLIMFNSNKIVNKVKRRWEFGRGVNGGIIGKYSNSAIGQDYKAFKVRKNPLAGGNVDLTLTGSLGDNLTIDILGENFEIISTDYKFNDIGYKYGFEQFNLTPQETELLISEIHYELIKEYTDNVWIKL